MNWVMIKRDVPAKKWQTKIKGYFLTLPTLSIPHSGLLNGSIWADVFNVYSPKVFFCWVVFVGVFFSSLRKKIGSLCSVH